VYYVHSGSPNITYYSSGIVTFEGKKVNLICNATNDEDAIDPVQISWYYNGTKLYNSDGKDLIIYNKYDNVTDQIYSELLLDSVNNTDDGEYICRAFNNPLCYIERKINLTVECEFILYTYVYICICYSELLLHTYVQMDLICLYFTRIKNDLKIFATKSEEPGFF